jgi:hypothetical protein
MSALFAEYGGTFGFLLFRITGFNIADYKGWILLPAPLHERFNQIVLALTCVAWLHLFVRASVTRKDAARAWPRPVVRAARALDAVLSVLFSVYMCVHATLYTIEVKFLSSLSRAPSYAMHHVFSTIAFVLMAANTGRLWRIITATTVTPFLMHALYWAVWPDERMLIAYNVTLSIANAQLLSQCRGGLLYSVVCWLWVLTANYWTYCDEYEGLFCLGTAIGYQHKPMGSRYVLNLPAVLSTALVATFITLPATVHLIRNELKTSSKSKSQKPAKLASHICKKLK